jgi:hypothetical protein
LATVVTAVCVYLGTWEITKRNGVRAIERSYYPDEISDLWDEKVASPMPFVVRGRFLEQPVYFLWLFGWSVKLPITPVTRSSKHVLSEKQMDRVDTLYNYK